MLHSKVEEIERDRVREMERDRDVFAWRSNITTSLCGLLSRETGVFNYDLTERRRRFLKKKKTFFMVSFYAVCAYLYYKTSVGLNAVTLRGRIFIIISRSRGHAHGYTQTLRA